MPAECFPLTFNLNGFNSRVYAPLFIFGLFLTLWIRGVRKPTPLKIPHKILTTDSLELKLYMYNLEVARHAKILNFEWLEAHSLLLSTLRFSKQKKFKITDQASTSGYKKPQCKTFLTTDEVLTALFIWDNDSDGSEISFDGETTSSEKFLDVPKLLDKTNLEEPCFRDTL